jgi:hypothetical protein
MITIKAIANYTDNQLKVETENKTKVTRNWKQIEVIDGKIQKGDFYTVSNKRANQIIDAKLAVLVAIYKEDKTINNPEDITTVIKAGTIDISTSKPKKKANKGNK